MREDIIKQEKFKRSGIPLFWKILALNLIFALFLIAIAEPYYETDDDFAAIALPGGFYGEASGDLVFNNIVLGQILKLLTGLCPVLSWHWGLMFAASVLSYSVIGVVLIKKMGYKYGLFFFSVFLIVTCYQFYVLLNFTRVAALATAGGWCGALYSMEYGTWKKGLIPSGLLLIYGAVLRFDSWLMVSAVAFSYFCVATLVQLHPFSAGSISGFLRRKIKYMAALTGIVLVVGALAVISQMYYNATPEWQDYNEYNHARSLLLDYGIPDYATNQEGYEALGISQDDLSMLQSWSFGDPEVFSLDHMQQMAGMREKSPWTFTELGKNLLDSCRYLLQAPLFLMGLFFIIVTMLLSKRKYPVSQGVLLLVTILLMIYLVHEGRVLPRVTVGLTMAFSLFVLCCVNGEELPQEVVCGKRGRILVVTALGSCLLLNGTLLLGEGTYGRHSAPTEELQAERQEILDTLDQSNLYLMDTFSRIYYFRLFPFWAGTNGFSQTNVYLLGSSFTMHPLYNQILRDYGVENPFKALYEKDNVFLIDTTNYETKRSYIQRHYADTVTFSVVDSVDKRYIFAASAIQGTVTAEPKQDLHTKIEFMNLTDDQNAGDEFYWLLGSLGSTGTEETAQLCYYLEMQRDGETRYFRFVPQEDTGDFVLGIPKEELTPGEYALRVITKQKDQTNYVWSSEAGELSFP